MSKDITIEWTKFTGDMRRAQTQPASSPMPGAILYEADDIFAGMEAAIAPGTLTAGDWITFDVLVEGQNSVVFMLELFDSEDDAHRFAFLHYFLNGASGRVRLPLTTMRQNQWALTREASCMKPIVWGDIIAPEKVTRMRLRIERKSDERARFWQTPARVVSAEPPRLEQSVLLDGPLSDAFGQSARRTWCGRVSDEAAMVENLRTMRDNAGAAQWPRAWTEWGGSRKIKFSATGFFRVERTPERFWLVTPEGDAFWSAGLDCVRSYAFATPPRGIENCFAWLPEKDGEFADAWTRRHPDSAGPEFVDFHVANLIRAFGADWYAAWKDIAAGALKTAGFNTVANWSDFKMASEKRLPYAIPLTLRFERSRMIFRDFPDVFDDAALSADAAALAAQLADSATDSALIGYFVGNEPTWGFAMQTPAEGMLVNTAACRSRDALADWLEAKYAGDASLAEAWAMPGATLANVREGVWQSAFTAAARADLEAFSTIMVARLFDTLGDACRAVDPNHLNLGARYYTIPPAWALAGMTSFDVFSINCYRETVPRDFGADVARVMGKPLLVGEWHFGALDVGLPSTGIGAVATQADRGRAFRRYVEHAAALPWCVGVHYFTMYDQAVTGRFDGENYNIGFYDVANQPYAPLVDAARVTHERLYDVASGIAAPYDDAPEYLPMVFC